ncbi:hypothetical protein PPAR_a2595 [Pseudoalteromonas paragorgicola KMM 3548]|nr:hypothetical protein [Pseudoalteromonas distincta KMM 3548]
MSIERFYEGVLHNAHISDIKLLLKRLIRESYDQSIISMIEVY